MKGIRMNLPLKIHLLILVAGCYKIIFSAPYDPEIESQRIEQITIHNSNLIEMSEEDLYQELEHILSYLSDRTGETLQEEVSVIFENPPLDVTVHSMEITHNAGRGIVIYVTPESNQNQIFGILAHQFAQIFHDQWTGSSVVMPIINKGVATLLSQKYWYQWHNIESFTTMIQYYLSEELYIPLEATTTEREIEGMIEREIIYNEWAAFLRYLLETYGQETYLKFLRQVAVKPEFGDAFGIDEFFVNVYHRPLILLERAWLTEFNE